MENTSDFNQYLNNILTPNPNNKAEKARSILGSKSQEFKDSELENLVSDFEFLADTWLDNFEKQIFNGKTLCQILRKI